MEGYEGFGVTGIGATMSACGTGKVFVILSRKPPAAEVPGGSQESVGQPTGPLRPIESRYYDLIGIGWSATADGGPRIVWRQEVPDIDPAESVRVFKYLEGPDIRECLAAIIEADPEVRFELVKMGSGTVCGGSPEAISGARALWTSYGFADALAEVATHGRRGEHVTTFLARCAALRGRETQSVESGATPR